MIAVAGLIATGRDRLRTCCVPGQLYLRPRMVDYHLRKVFTKLGITSRTELVRDCLPRPGLNTHDRPGVSHRWFGNLR